MKFKEIVDRLKAGDKIKIKNKIYKVLTHIVWRQGFAQVSYNKYVLEDDQGNNEFRFFVSDDYEYAGIGVIFKYPFEEPLPENLEFEGKNYELMQEEFCVADKVMGEEFYKEGDAEIWWDYESVDETGKGLSLGRGWKSWKREDLDTTALNHDEIEIVDN